MNLSDDTLKASLAHLRETTPQAIAESLVSVQPMDSVDFHAIMKDPLAMELVNNFVNRLKGGAPDAK